MNNIHVGHILVQTKAIEEFGFNFVGTEFEVTEIRGEGDNLVFHCMSINSTRGNQGVRFVASLEEIQNHFKLKEEPNYDNTEKFTQNSVKKHFSIDHFYLYNGNEPEEKCKRIISGNVVTVIHEKTGQKGRAKCSPQDEFNLDTGTLIATNRLLKKILNKELKALLKDVELTEQAINEVDEEIYDLTHTD